MERFSTRMGFKPKRKEMQIHEMSDELRTGLWNLIWIAYLNRDMPGGMDQRQFAKLIWLTVLRDPIDEVPYMWDRVCDRVKQRFFGYQWYEVYDFIEGIVDIGDDATRQPFIEACNSVLEREKSGYRFVGERIAPVVSGVEIQAIEDAIEYPLETVSNHISQALQLFADRKDPDYRNSIKESISAVEALCRAIAGDDKATLSQALHIIERQGKVRIHPALIEGLSKIYGYTSDESGIRHALIENKEPSTSADAQFMLIMCSAFIHYLSAKATDAGVPLS